MELWDAYDSDFRKVDGVALIRGEPIPEGLRHLVCDVIVRHTDGSYLLMQRDMRKQYGGMWEASAGGSALQNDTPAVCAARELLEETGIRADHLEEVGRTTTRDTFYVEFLCVTDCAKDSVRLQQGETVDYRWVGAPEFFRLLRTEPVLKKQYPRYKPYLDSLEQQTKLIPGFIPETGGPQDVQP